MSLLSNPDLLVLDEPTTGMDLESIDNLWGELKVQTSSSLIVTHDFNQIDNYFTRIIIIKNNQIVADEKVIDIHNKNKTIENFYRSIIGGKNND
jgi:ABC-type multidrug transport system, ATPase component